MSMRPTLEESDKIDAVLHIVNDYTNLVSSGTLIQSNHQPPINTHVQYSFLVECRKFAGFFLNSGTSSREIKSRDYLNRTMRLKLPVWRKWHDHMNVHLMHLSYDRIHSQTEWDGRIVNAQLLSEFRNAWKLFLPNVAEQYKSEFEKQIAASSSKAEYRGLDLT